MDVTNPLQKPNAPSPTQKIKKYKALGIFFILCFVFIGAFVYMIFFYTPTMHCDALLPSADIKNVLDTHPQAIDHIKGLGGFSVEQNDPSECAGKSEVIIYHGTQSQAEAIRAYLGASFFGAPYRLLNM